MSIIFRDHGFGCDANFTESHPDFAAQLSKREVVQGFCRHENGEDSSRLGRVLGGHDALSNQWWDEWLDW